MKDAAIRLLGADPIEVRLLTKTLKQEQQYRFISNLQNGMDLSSLKMLVGFPLLIIAFINIALISKFRQDTALAALMLLSMHTSVYFGFNGFKILHGLLSDEDYQVVASYPLRSNSFLVAQLHGPFREALLLTTFTLLPACLVGTFVLSTPVVDGLVLFLVSVIYTVGLMLLTAIATTLGMRAVGLDNLRVGVLACSMLVMVAISLYLPNGKAVTEALRQMTFADAPILLPLTWIAALMSPLTYPLEALAGLIMLLPVPALVFRKWAGDYTRLLGTSQLKSGRVGGRWFYKLVTLGSKNPADGIMATLCLAHARSDWRFRGQALFAPTLFLALTLHHWVGIPPEVLFADPFALEGVFHFSMLLVVLIALPPLIALPIITTSTHYRASWILSQGVIPESAYRAAFRRMARVLFVGPYIGIIAVFYLLNDVPLLHVAAQIFMMVMIAELLVIGTQSIFKGYPFSRPSGDEELSFTMLPLVMCLEALGTLIVVFIYNVVYQWWWAYLGWALLMLVIRKQILINQDRPPKPKQTQKMEDVPDLETTPLIAAVKDGRYHIAKTLLSAGADPNQVGPDNKSARQWAEELGDHRIRKLFQEEGPAPSC